MHLMRAKSRVRVASRVRATARAVEEVRVLGRLGYNKI